MKSIETGKYNTVDTSFLCHLRVEACLTSRRLGVRNYGRQFVSVFGGSAYDVLVVHFFNIANTGRTPRYGTLVYRGRFQEEEPIGSRRRLWRTNARNCVY